MQQQKQDALFYNFIKLCFESHSLNVSEKLIISLSSDMEFKIHEIAKVRIIITDKYKFITFIYLQKLTRNIMLKSKRNCSKTEDINSALNLTFKNVILLLNFEVAILILISVVISKF